MVNNCKARATLTRDVKICTRDNMQESGGTDLQHRGLRYEQADRVVPGLQQRGDIRFGDMQHQQHLLQAKPTHSLLQHKIFAKKNSISLLSSF
jgi:hypothetical protein